jgi:hypothetical protein
VKKFAPGNLCGKPSCAAVPTDAAPIPADAGLGGKHPSWRYRSG